MFVIIQNKNYKISSLIMFKYLKKFYNIYLEDKDLLPYQKVLLFCSNTIYFVSIQVQINMNQKN